MLRPCTLNVLLDYPFADTVPQLFEFFTTRDLCLESIQMTGQDKQGISVQIHFQIESKKLQLTLEELARQASVIKLE